MSSKTDLKQFALTLFSAAGLASPALANQVDTGTTPPQATPSALDVLESRIYQSIIPLTIDNHPAQNVVILIGEDTESTIKVDAAGLTDQLKNILDAKVIDEIRGKAVHERDRNWIKLKDIQDAGIEAQFDNQALELKIGVPVMLRKVNRISMTRENGFSEQEGTHEISSISSYVNVNASQDFQFGSAVQTKGRQPLRSEFDSAINLKNWIAEGNVGYTEPVTLGPYKIDESPWRRGDIRVLRDQPDRSMRYSVGDVIYPSSGFQRYQSIGGAAVVTNFGLQPYRTFTASSNHEIVLKSRSRVKIWVNERPIQTLDLPAGRHDIRDFPFIAGVNNVKLEITDDVGRTETVTFPYVYSDLLLEQGVHQVSYAIGAPSYYSGNSRRYTTNESLISLSHRYGLNASLTYGGYAQANRLVNVLGTSFTFANTLGAWTVESAGSRNVVDSKYGAGGRIGYIFTDYLKSDGSQRTIGASVEGKSPDFSLLTDRYTGLTSAYNLSLSYSQQILSFCSLSTTYGVPIARNTGAAAFSANSLSVALARNWKRGVETTVTYLHTQDAFAPPQSTFFFLLNWTIPNKNQFVTASANTQEGSGRMEWNYNPTRAVGATNLGVGIERSPTAQGADARIEHQGNRARAGLTHDLDLAQGGASTQRTSLRAGTAIVMADGHFAISRPVTDSFVMVRTIKDMTSENVQINPQPNGNYDSRADFLGPAVISDLTSYRRHYLHAAAPEAPISLGFTEETYPILPTYKSGTVITIGRERSAFVRGQIHKHGGEPLIVGSGEVREIGNPESAVQFLFTNRAGNFSLEGLHPGKYEIQFYDASLGHLEFEIPKETVGIYDIGILVIDAKKEIP